MVIGARGEQCDFALSTNGSRSLARDPQLCFRGGWCDGRDKDVFQSVVEAASSYASEHGASMLCLEGGGASFPCANDASGYGAELQGPRAVLRVQGVGAARPVLDCGGRARAFVVSGPDSQADLSTVRVELANLELRRGWSSDRGGCLLVQSASILMLDSSLVGCVSGSGGGLWVETAGSEDGVRVDMILRRVQARDCASREAASGGAVGDPKPPGSGGTLAVWVAGPGPAVSCNWTLDRVTVSNSSAVCEGAPFECSGSQGGAVYARVGGDWLGGTWSMVDTVLSESRSWGSGGGLHFEVAGSVTSGLWSVSGATAFDRTRCESDNGGGLRYLVGGSVNGGEWWLGGQTVFNRTRAPDGWGGGVSHRVQGTVSGGLWRIGDAASFVDTRAAGNGGAVAYVVQGGVAGGAWQIEDAAAFIGTTAGIGGAVYYNVQQSVQNSTWSVAGQARFEGTSSSNQGGAIAYEIAQDVLGGQWEVTGNASFGSTTAGGSYGGSIAFVVRTVSGGSWSISGATTFVGSSSTDWGGAVAYRAHSVLGGSWVLGGSASFLSSAAEQEGGSVAYEVNYAVVGGLWSVEDQVSFVQASSGQHGGAIYYRVSQWVTGGTWRVAGNVTFAGTAAALNGGAIYYDGSSCHTGGTWTIDNTVGFLETRAGGNGGGVAWTGVYVHDSCSSSDSLARGEVVRGPVGAGHSLMPSKQFGGRFIGTSANLDGGAMWVSTSGPQPQSVAILGIGSSTHSGGRGGFAYITLNIEPAAGQVTQLTLSGLACSNCTAEQAGGVAYLQVQAPAQSAGKPLVPCCSLEMRMADVVVSRATGGLQGGAFVVDVTPPYVHPPPAAQAGGGRASAASSQQYYPVSYFHRLDVQNVTLRDVLVVANSSDGGAAFALENANALFRDIHVMNATSPAMGGVLSASGYTNVTVADAYMEGVRSGASAALVHSTDRDVNLTLVNVTCSTQALRSTSNTTGIITVDHLSLQYMKDVKVSCPVGTSITDQSLGWSPILGAVSVCDPPKGGSGCTKQTTQTHLFFGGYDTQFACVQCEPSTYNLAAPTMASKPCNANSTCSPLADRGSAFSGSLLDFLFTKLDSLCHPCPFGATCQNGSHVVTRSNFWGTTAREQPTVLISRFVVLPHGYGCEGGECTTHTSCAGKRTGFACGQCAEGFTEALGTSSCVPQSDCGRRWQDVAFWPGYIVLVLLALALYYQATKRAPRTFDASVMLTILANLYQMGQMCYVNGGSSDRWVPLWAGELANLRPRGDSGPWSGLGFCVVPGLSAAGKLLLLVLLAVLTIVLVLLVWRIHALLDRCCHGRQRGSGGAGRRRGVHGRCPPRLRVRRHRPEAYMASLVLLVSLLYGTIGEAVVRLFAPLRVETYSLRLGISGNLEWLGTWWQVLAFLWFVFSTLPAPMAYLRGYKLLHAKRIEPWVFALYIQVPVAGELMYRFGNGGLRRDSVRDKRASGRALDAAERGPESTEEERGRGALEALLAAAGPAPESKPGTAFFTPPAPRSSTSVPTPVAHGTCSKTKVLERLSAPYSKELSSTMAGWWGMVFMLRRLLFLLPTLGFVGRPEYKVSVQLVLAVGYLVLHMQCRPFLSAHAHALETLSLAVLCVLCSVNLHYATMQEDAVMQTTESATRFFVGVEAAFVMLPPCVGLGLLLHHWRTDGKGVQPGCCPRRTGRHPAPMKRQGSKVQLTSSQLHLHPDASAASGVGAEVSVASGMRGEQGAPYVELDGEDEGGELKGVRTGVAGSVRWLRAAGEGGGGEGGVGEGGGGSGPGGRGDGGGGGRWRVEGVPGAGARSGVDLRSSVSSVGSGASVPRGSRPAGRMRGMKAGRAAGGGGGDSGDDV